MLLNEDYFNDLKLTDKDITTEENVFEYNDIRTLDSRLNSIYKQCIVIQIKPIKSMFSNVYLYSQVLWNKYIPDIMKKMQYLFNTYHTDYEYVLLEPLSNDFDEGDAELSVYEIGDYKVLSGYREEDLFYDDTYHSLFILFYVNIPSFTFKQSYFFIDRMYNTICEKYKDLISAVKVLRTPKSLFEGIPWSNKNGFEIYPNSRLINPKLPFRIFFHNAISFFHSSDSERKIIDFMVTDVISGINPFMSVMYKHKW